MTSPCSGFVRNMVSPTMMRRGRALARFHDVDVRDLVAVVGVEHVEFAFGGKEVEALGVRADSAGRDRFG